MQLDGMDGVIHSFKAQRLWYTLFTGILINLKRFTNFLLSVLKLYTEGSNRAATAKDIHVVLMCFCFAEFNFEPMPNEF